MEHAGQSPGRSLKQRLKQPGYVLEFHCLGAECEDTCCSGWGITIDRDTYEKYQAYPEAETRAQLASLVTIHAASTGSSDFARIRLEGIQCPALQEGLCSIQRSLGEPYLSDMCSTFPRVLNEVNGAVERSLHLSCPEAARLALMNPERMAFDVLEEAFDGRPGSLSRMPEADGDGIGATRQAAIEILQERSRPLWMRLLAMGYAVDALVEGGLPVFQECLDSFRRGAFDHLAERGLANHTVQLEFCLELIVGRITPEYASPRFLKCYGEFMRGLGWDATSSMDELAASYGRAFQLWWQPFSGKHEYLLENYLVNYAFRTFFPFGRREANQKLAIDRGGTCVRNAYMVLATDYVIVRTLLVGMAGLHGQEFGVEHVVLLIQSFTKAFQHSRSFPGAALQKLAELGMLRASDLAVLVAD